MTDMQILGWAALTIFNGLLLWWLVAGLMP
jgi:hypothetical protein